MAFRYETLSERLVPDLVETFNDAFSAYELPVNMTEDRLRDMIAARSVRLDHSLGAFDGDVLAAFVLNGSRRLDGILTAYDSGTGVRTAYQGRGLGKALISGTTAYLASEGYGTYLLEVLTGNDPAIGLYKKQGFVILRRFTCLKRPSSPIAAPAGFDLTTTRDREEIPWERITGIGAPRPSWQNAREAVEATRGEIVFTYVVGAGGEAFAIFAPAGGNLMQFGSADHGPEAAQAALAGVLEENASDELRIINVDERETAHLELLGNLGFRAYAEQFEMARSLG